MQSSVSQSSLYSLTELKEHTRSERKRPVMDGDR